MPLILTTAILLLLCGFMELILRGCKGLFPALKHSKATRTLVSWAGTFVLLFVLWSSVPGKTQHVESLKRMAMDALSENSNAESSMFLGWLKNTATSVAVDMFLQNMRIERHVTYSIGYIETDRGWVPATVGFAGIVFRWPFGTAVECKKPQVDVSIEGIGINNYQILLHNVGNGRYECTVSSRAKDAKSPLSEFALDAQSSVRIVQEKKGFANKIKSFLKKDKTLVEVPAPITSDIYVTFKCGRVKMKEMGIVSVDKKLDTYWANPK